MLGGSLSRVDMAEQLEQQLPATRNLHESLSRAEELATRRKHSVVGLDHLLLALGQDPEAVAVLLVCKVDVEALCMDLLRKLGPEARMRSPNTVPPTFDVTVQNLIAHASAAALQSGQAEIDGSNILSAIISGEGGMITHKILQRHGLTFNETVSNLGKGEKPEGPPKNSNAPEAKTQQNEEPNTSTFKLVPGVQSVQNDQEVNQKTAGADLSDRAENNKTAEKANKSPQNGAPLDAQRAESSVVQAEARPEDYGMPEDGREYHPVPPQNQTPPNTREQNHKGPVQHSSQINHHAPKQGMQPNLNRPPHQMRSPLHNGPITQSQDQEPLPSILSRTKNLGDQVAQAQNNIKNVQPVEMRENDRLVTPPAQHGRKVDFSQSSINQSSAGQEENGKFSPQQEMPGSEHSPQNEGEAERLNRAQAGDKFSQEDKYGNIPPNPPVPPMLGHAENSDDLTPRAEGPVLSLPQADTAPVHQQAPINQANLSTGFPNNFPEGLPNGQPRNIMPGNPPLYPPKQQDPNQGPQGRGLQGMPGLQGQQPNQSQLGQKPGQMPVSQQHGLPLGQVPTQEKMDGIAASIQQSQKARDNLSDQDQVVENIPKVMRVGKIHFLEVRVARFANTEIDLSPEDYGLRAKQGSTPITKAITVRLTGPDGQFLIDCATSSTQWTEMQGGMTNDADFAIWRWRVQPRKSGVSKLRLDITARTSNEDGLTAEIPIQPSKSIDVKVTRNYGAIIKRAIMIGCIFIAGYGIAEYGNKAYDLVQAQVEEFKKTD